MRSLGGDVCGRLIALSPLPQAVATAARSRKVTRLPTVSRPSREASAYQGPKSTSAISWRAKAKSATSCVESTWRSRVSEESQAIGSSRPGKPWRSCWQRQEKISDLVSPAIDFGHFSMLPKRSSRFLERQLAPLLSSQSTAQPPLLLRCGDEALDPASARPPRARSVRRDGIGWLIPRRERPKDGLRSENDSIERFHDSIGRSQDSLGWLHDCLERSHNSIGRLNDSTGRCHHSIGSSHDSTEHRHDSIGRSHHSFGRSQDSIEPPNRSMDCLRRWKRLFKVLTGWECLLVGRSVRLPEMGAWVSLAGNRNLPDPVSKERRFTERSHQAAPEGVRHVHPPRQARLPLHPDSRRRGGPSAPRVRLRRDRRFRSVPAPRRLPQRPPGGL